MLDSDTLYHQLFSHPLMVEELVREFVPEAVATDLDFSGLQRVNAKFYTSRESAQRREGDVIWRLPTHEDSDIYLLLEFQSESNRWMSIRTQVYEGLLWQQIIDEKRLTTDARLPPLLLLVLYNGVPRWNAETDIHQLIALSPDSPLWPWQPQVRYHLLDMGAFPLEELRKHVNLATLLFRLERRSSIEEIKDLTDELLGIFRQLPDSTRLKRLFDEFVCRAYAEWGVTGSKPEDLQMFRSNLFTLGEHWKQEWRAEGRAEGLAEGEAKGEARGEAKGLVKGKANALVSLLVEKFGALTPSVQDQISTADLATLDTWFKRAIVAPDLASVFFRSH